MFRNNLAGSFVPGSAVPRTWTAGSLVQSVLFDKDVWAVGDARRWLDTHDFRSDDFDPASATARYMRFRQADPDGFAALRTGSMPGLKGVRVVFGPATRSNPARPNHHDPELEDKLRHGFYLLGRSYAPGMPADKVPWASLSEAWDSFADQDDWADIAAHASEVAVLYEEPSAFATELLSNFQRGWIEAATEHGHGGRPNPAIQDVAALWADGQASAGGGRHHKAGNFRSDGRVLWSCWTPIAVLQHRTAHVVTEWYSSTTTRHQGAARRAAQRAGLAVVPVRTARDLPL